MEFYESEAAILSIYTNWKLKNGGEPKVDLNELKGVYEKFLKSKLYSNEYKNMKDFVFPDTATLAKQFQKLSPAHKPCFTYDENTFYPTYSFRDIMDSDNHMSLFFLFLNDARYRDFTPGQIQMHQKVQPEYSKNASAAALSLTEELARLYIGSLIENRKGWPNKNTNPYQILNNDFSSLFHFPGNRQYFTDFYQHALNCIKSMLEDGDGKLRLSNDKRGTLEYNNLARLLRGYPLLEALCKKSDKNVEDKNFDIVITPRGVKCNHKKFEADTQADYFVNDEEEEI